MHFEREKNECLHLLLFGVASFVAGMTLEDIINLNKHIVTLIGIGMYILIYVIYRLRIELNPLRKIERKIHKQPYKHQQLKMFFDEYIPETKKTYPKTIYKYVYLDDISGAEKETLNSFSNLSNLENWILSSLNRTPNQNKLCSLATDSLWFTRSSSPALNDPFEGRRITYDDDLFPLNEAQIEHWKQYAENIRNNLFLCCFSKNNDFPSMWAHYANNYKGYCLEFEIIDFHNLWKVYYGRGKNTLNFELKELQKDLWEGRITRDETYKYIEQLHIYWASSKHDSWQYEEEIRALLSNLNKDMNITYETIGIKLSAIIIGHNCAEEHRKFLVHIANKLSIPIKTTILNTTNNNFLDIVNYDESKQQKK